MINENEISGNELTDNELYFYQFVTCSCYGIDPQINLESSFNINNIQVHLKANPTFYLDMIKKTFLDNKTKLTIIVKSVKDLIELIQQKKNKYQGQIDKIMKNYGILEESSKKPQ